MNKTHIIGHSAETIVLYRFTEAGRRVSWPLYPAPYDLIVDGGGQLFRVQVKAMTELSGGRWRVSFAKRGRERRLITEADYYCLVTTPDRIYVVPTAVLTPAHAPERLLQSLEIGRAHSMRLEPFLNKFALGTGESLVPRTVSDVTPAKRALWFTKQRAAKAEKRKPHKRLTTAEAEAIRNLPANVAPKDIAAQFGVTLPTVYNLMKGKRKDLRTE